MDASEVKVGKNYKINFAPLIASRERSSNSFVGEVLHKLDNAAWVSPKPPCSPVPLYISYHWFEEEAHNA
jgi:hypothetical protein